ncbi:hypothetical protein F4808DRAFT_443523 [Astrocystis sublimbata]|nr:hypothetical protein F4808DRAFT_443523 [Astrocystis sublimbata]
MSSDSQYLCTSSLSSPMAFLVMPDITTADVYTTLAAAPELWIEHDQMTVQWEASDLEHLPSEVVSQYQGIMRITDAPLPSSSTALSTTDTTTDTSSSKSETTSTGATPAPGVETMKTTETHLTVITQTWTRTKPSRTVTTINSIVPQSTYTVTTTLGSGHKGGAAAPRRDLGGSALLVVGLVMVWMCMA